MIDLIEPELPTLGIIASVYTYTRLSARSPIVLYSHHPDSANPANV